MVAFIITWLICSIISFAVYSCEQFFHNKQYTLRDVFMGLLIAVGGPLYTFFCLCGFIGVYLAKLFFLIDEFIENKDMYTNTVIVTQSNVINKINKLLKK